MGKRQTRRRLGKSKVYSSIQVIGLRQICERETDARRSQWLGWRSEIESIVENGSSPDVDRLPAGTFIDVSRSAVTLKSPLLLYPRPTIPITPYHHVIVSFLGWLWRQLLRAASICTHLLPGML